MSKLSQSVFSLDHHSLVEFIAQADNILIIQDLDGVCMDLVKDPLTRTIDPEYLQAAKSLERHFFVLTNGEHIGKRGVKGIVERAFKDDELVKKDGLYLPGLAGGGVQWQDCYGNVSHPGVSQSELDFLDSVPQKIDISLRKFFKEHDCGFSPAELDQAIASTILTNKVSPTVNLNVFYEELTDKKVFAQLQQEMKQLTEDLLAEAKLMGLDDSFFVHYAPNLGRDEQGKEIMQVSADSHSGTTDLQFMLRGAVKEAGVLFLLNNYYYLQTGRYPLGEKFNSREAPRTQAELLALVKDKFDPALMPAIIGVGDTVTSKAETQGEELIFRRGGSDRGFLELVQAIGQEFNTENLVVYVDSSAGELKNRQALKLDESKTKVISGIGDPRDQSDPLTLNVVFPGGYQEYTQMFQTAAQKRNANSN